MSPANPRHIPSLDGLRAIAILMVCVSHLAQTQGSPLHNFSSLGYLGVRVFFVVSGLLITRLLVQERERRGSISLRNFFLRRTLRIFPAMWFYLAVMIALSALGMVTLWPGDMLHAFTYTVNYDQHRSWYTGHLWSLSVEEQFYLLWPLVLRFGTRTTALNTAIATVLAAPVLRAVTLLVAPSAPIVEWFPTICDALATGCLLSLLPANFIRRVTDRIPDVAILALPLTAFLLNSLQYHVDHRYWIFFASVGQTVINLLIGISIYWLVDRPNTLAGRIVNLRPLAWLGTLSYSLYLWQQPFLNHGESRWFTQFPSNLLFGFIMALFSYYLVERPVLRLKDRIGRTPASPRTTPAGSPVVLVGSGSAPVAET